MLNGIIFDFDGVIVDTESKKFRDLKNILQKYNYRLEKNAFPVMIGKKTSAFLTEKFPTIPQDIAKNIVKQRKKLQYSNIKDYRLIPGIKELLIFLKSKKYVIALVTGSDYSFVKKTLVNHSLYNYFDIIVSGKEFASSKPNPECYKLALKKLQLSPAEIIVVEDSVAGIKAAKAIGCKVFALRTYLKRDYLSKADKSFKNHFGILKHLRKE